MNPETALQCLYMTHNSFPTDKETLKSFVITHRDGELSGCRLSPSLDTSHGQVPLRSQ